MLAKHAARAATSFKKPKMTIPELRKRIRICWGAIRAITEELENYKRDLDAALKAQKRRKARKRAA